jgi:hypothetical protein
MVVANEALCLHPRTRQLWSRDCKDYRSADGMLRVLPMRCAAARAGISRRLLSEQSAPFPIAVANISVTS